MKKRGSPFRRYLWVHFLIVLLLPLLILVMAVGVFPDGESPAADAVNQSRSATVLISLLLAVLVMMSWLFFYRLRRRLIHLREAMDAVSPLTGLPLPVEAPPNQHDEVGQLADAFNGMIRQLESSRNREREEEALRQRLIANLSHDLRTPLTVLRGQLTGLRAEPLGPEGHAALETMDRTITRMGEWMEELLSYTLLTSGKYPFRPGPEDIVKLVRSSAAAWYPVFENAGFRIEAELPEQGTLCWEVDPAWMTRVLDNLYQNVLRHAASGRYIRIAVDMEREELEIEDRGPGMTAPSAESGAGIGLSIALFMLREMGLQARFSSDGHGTTVRIGTI